MFVETAHSDDGVLQGIRHMTLPIEAVQFHPESVLTIEGKALLGNFVSEDYGLRITDHRPRTT